MSTSSSNILLNSASIKISGAANLSLNTSVMNVGAVFAISINGSNGTNGQTIISNGSAISWGVGFGSGNAYTWSNTQTFTSNVLFGNSTVNSAVNSTYVAVQNSITNTVLTPGNINIGNTVINGTSISSNTLSINAISAVSSINVGNTYINSTYITVNGSISANVLLAGTNSASANGFTVLTNGFILNWGTFVCNTISNISFSKAYVTNVFSISVTPLANTYVGANTPFINSQNNSGANIHSVSTTTTNTCSFTAIGI